MSSMKFYKNKKVRLLIPFLLLVVFGLVGTSFAWAKQEVSVENKLKAHTTEISIEEDFEPETGKKVVEFKNNGSSSVFLRMTWTEYWETADGKILSNQIDGKEVATKKWTEAYEQQWQAADPADGWFYYTRILPAGESTNMILTKVEFPEEYKGDLADYKDAEYHLYFQVEAVQASDSAGTLNSAQVNADATWTTWHMTATVGDDGTVTWSAQAPAQGNQEGGDGV